MGHKHDPDWIAQVAHKHAGKRVLEVGAGHEDSLAIRAVCEAAGCHYIGTDMFPWRNVDIVHDLTEPLDIEPVSMIICLSVIEHCKAPWLLGKHLEDVLEPGGELMVAVPWIWRVHNYPADYWRVSPEGLKVLFPRVTFKEIFPVPLDHRWNMQPKGKVITYGRGIRNAD